MFYGFCLMYIRKFTVKVEDINFFMKIKFIY